MLKLLTIGVSASLFFSSTFILNRAMSLAGGHWVWSAGLRYLFMALFIMVVLAASGRMRVLRAGLALGRRTWRFWLVAGTIGFGVFYAGITLAAEYAPGWVVATTWQTTILVSPLVLRAFGRKVPLKGIFFTLLIFGGIVLVNAEHAADASWRTLLLGALPVLAAAIAYPVGNQMVWEAKRGARRAIPHITDPVLDDTLVRVLLLTLGTGPFWLLCIVITRPPPPTPSQWLNTALVALLSGLIATGLFLYARQRAESAYEIAAVDATQSMEVLFSLAGEVLLLGGLLPGLLGWAGVALTIIGLALYLLAQSRP
ncbi:MAG: multidrug resistance efflux transporter family protein [Caldilineaceae bacterium]|nr:multidrug resistance efflux transporter family protein [Caldilineaceae bacterium]